MDGRQKMLLFTFLIPLVTSFKKLWGSEHKMFQLVINGIFKKKMVHSILKIRNVINKCYNLMKHVY